MMFLFVKQQLETTRDTIPSGGIPKWNTVNHGIKIRDVIREKLWMLYGIIYGYHMVKRQSSYFHQL